MTIYVTNPINETDSEIGEFDEVTLALAAALKSGLKEAGYTDVPKFLSHDENWINIQFVTNGGGGTDLPIVRTVS